MNGLLFPRPARWGKAWALHRRQRGTDSEGDPIALYDMEHPDYTATAGSEGAVAWQVKSSGADVAESGEQVTGQGEGVVYDSALSLSPFDRVVFDGATWEITAVVPWNRHRKVEVKRL